MEGTLPKGLCTGTFPTAEGTWEPRGGLKESAEKQAKIGHGVLPGGVEKGGGWTVRKSPWGSGRKGTPTTEKKVPATLTSTRVFRLTRRRKRSRETFDGRGE